MNSLQVQQAYIFLIFILNGILIGIVFDIFRILRKSFKTSDVITYIEDVIFWVMTGLITLYFLFTFNNGEIRFYIFVGIILGIIIYMLSISKYFIKVNVTIITFLKNVIGKVVSILLYPIKVITKILKRIFFRPISFIFINIRKVFTKSKLKIDNIMKKMYKPTKKEVIKKDF